MLTTSLRSLSIFRAIIVGALILVSLVALFGTAPARAEEDYLAPEKAFQFSARMADANMVEVSYAIAPGYYMYRERFGFKADGAKLGEPLIPKGKIKFDETFQKDVESYRESVTIRIPVEASGPFELTATSQGCADAGLCYPPMDSAASLDPAVITGPATPGGITSSSSQDSEMGRIEASLQGGKLLVILPLFLLLGLGLAFTPCVLPMVPILSSIILGGKGRVSRGRGFLLSVVYSLGMAIVYTMLGVAAGLAGEGLAASLQNPWVLGGFALLMALMSLSMFGMFNLQMPAFIQARLAQVSEKQSAGKMAGVFAMGALSALIVGPCVAAPLAGTLVYISQTRDVFIGGSALFAMAAGMSIPLLLVGASAGTLLPRSGAWMESIKRFFGVLMLATAWWMVSPVIPAAVQMAGWTILGLGYAGYLLWPGRGAWISKTAGLAFAAFGLLQLVGVATGGRDVLAPIAHLRGEPVHKTEFVRVKSVEELDAYLAGNREKTVMLDFYADWCVSCIEMEKLTFTDQRVKDHFAGMALLQADVTANNADDKALLKRFSLFGPPGIIFFDRQGREIADSRVIGYQSADKFLQSLSRVNPARIASTTNYPK
ncbi:protein-disulfide reductase DsbD [Oxalobacteraceae bacterium R-40]|uniref:Thiol:disulfide interchange protein DsbD n=1 Tax=Keguizhuia sedimenti TaxID=3064264 RepID=A0ABU1BW96_9BURK|nr:protein-disulfide reductase DsbD [Oxalobacteraceae bacterium R-40]